MIYFSVIIRIDEEKAELVIDKIILEPRALLDQALRSLVQPGMSHIIQLPTIEADEASPVPCADEAATVQADVNDNSCIGDLH